jgi:hypothetical protein
VLDAAALEALTETRNLPSLCTITGRGWPAPSAAALRGLARVPGMPHLSLFVFQQVEWVIGGGKARKVSPRVWLRERDTFEQGTSLYL